MTGENAERIVADGRSWAEQDDRDALIGYGVFTGIEFLGLGRKKSECPVFHIEVAPGEPKKPVAIGVRYAGFRQSQSMRKYAHAGGRRSSMP